MKSFVVENLNLYYGETHALKNISMSIKEKTVTTFIGPSGCGKSSLLRMFNRMNDLIPITSHSGEILFEGKDIYDSQMDVVELRTKVGMVFQEPNPFPMSIYDNVAYGLRVGGIKDKDVLDKAVDQAFGPSSFRGSTAALMYCQSYCLKT